MKIEVGRETLEEAKKALRFAQGQAEKFAWAPHVGADVRRIHLADAQQCRTAIIEIDQALAGDSK